jgi:UPF0755 protein
MASSLASPAETTQEDPMKVWKSALIAILAVLLLGAGAGYVWLNQPLSLAADAVEVSIEPGTPPRRIADAWVQAGVRSSPFLLYEWFRWSGQAKRIRAGSYQIDGPTTPVQLLEMMISGNERMAFVRFNEGWTMRQVRAELTRAEALKPVTAAMSDVELMSALGDGGTPAEGRFFPDTYSYSKGSTDLAVLRRAHRAMARQLQSAWAERASDTPLKSDTELLTLASIVEKETGHESDRGKVAAVFVNRLRIDMPLQTDPSVIYGLGVSFDGNLRRRDLQADTPFNTYTRNGLPPTPIAMPGKASLLAAAHPSPGKSLYFVARGDGSSEFSDDLAAHNRAVNKYQRSR